ncbi:macrolide export protein MacA [Oxobacter pfennigii]|uniref:Macrolide export protein MacA n=1 Tax=Oxobacter pfennigii TaxID=36849 RepID=A0A0P8WAI7_9CLOT|nr:HlyD family efflux transporter periplasmic adaptor subunit [Oxobacter pfennigii]KPU44726.1 macrolide export protein MacA [Oxobacter pfennigii]
MKKKVLIFSAVLVLAIAAVIGWRLSVSKAQSKTDIQTFTLKKSDLLDSVLVSGRVISSNNENVYSKVTNYPIKKVNVEVGDKVKAGDVLAQLDTSSLELDIKQTELNIKNAEASLINNDLSNEYRLQNALNDLESASLELENSQKSFNQIKELYEAGASSMDEFSKAESALKKAQLFYDNAQASLQNIKNENTTTAKNNVDLQKVALEKQRKALNDSKIVAPIDGTITMVNAKENGSAAGLLFVIEDTDNLIVSTEIGEYDINLVEIGQEVVIKTDGTGDKQFMGTVSKIAPTALKDSVGNTASSSNVEFDTEIQLKDKDPSIKIGMNVRLTIKLNEKKDVYSVPYDAISEETDGSQWIYVLETEQKDGKSSISSRKIEVETGMETDMYIEISSPDLKDGMIVQANPKDILK